MSIPPTVYNDPPTATSYIYRVDGNVIFPGIKWNDSPEANTNQLIKKINSGQFPDLKSFSNRYIHGCPFNDLSKSIDANQLKTFEWRNNEEQKGFIPSHEGPCEIWIDDTLIFNNTNCAKAYTSYPVVIPIDYSVCSGTCQFEFYWMTMQEPLWQIYKSCAIITHKSSNTPSNIPSMPPTVSSISPLASSLKLICNTMN